MVSSDGEPHKGFDVKPGGLVWVRRWNGSWWPAQILDLDELPEADASRTGTPVKLLGRENANVEWYDAEKLNRVKGFRCKEHEECIKRVQMLGSLPPNKRISKNARRDDAIRHALELENARLQHKQPTDESEDDSYSSRNDSQSGEEDGLGHVDSADEEPKLKETENDSDEDGLKGAKRMRGLQDLGMGLQGRKRAQVSRVLKRKKQRALTKVMECASVVYPAGEDSNESKRNKSLVINNNSDSNGVKDSVLTDGSFLDGKNSAGISDEAISVGNEEVTLLKAKGALGWCLTRKRDSRSRKCDGNSHRNVSPRNEPPQRVLPIRQSRFTTNPKYDNSYYSLDDQSVSGLYNVQVEVERGYRPQQVPYISLMSKFTGRPITGHPIQVHLSKDDDNPESDSEAEDTVIPEKSGTHKGRVGRGRNLKRKRGSSQKNWLLLKKTRKLSSLTGPHQLSQTKTTKPQPKGPTLACVPLNVVFSRINAALRGY